MMRCTIRGRAAWTIAWAMLTCAPSIAQAQTPTEEPIPIKRTIPIEESVPIEDPVPSEKFVEHPDDTRRDWALTAGFHTPRWSWGAGHLGHRPAGTAMTLEHRLGDRFWWLLRGGAGFDRVEQHSDYGTYAGNTLDLSVATGFRWVANPDDAVQFSPMMLAGVGYGLGEYDYQQMTSTRAHATIGLTVDYAVTSAFGLRMSSELLTAGYSRAHSRYDDGVHVQDDLTEGWAIGLALAPALEARFAF